jgi:hypothetical protein
MRGDYSAITIGALNTDHTLSTSTMARKVLKLTTLTKAIRSRDKERLLIINSIERNNEVITQKPYAANTSSRSTHPANIRRGETHRAPSLS